ncbi:xylulose kinase [Leifsonia xyli subsp. xyli]|uniref:Xylulose kinase n=2 Tax=Leifsonia xyli subsp. xyli TaxID=59736 RepID=Q6AGZ2_LEIXX|nr:FGGY family carbohydrate kinase [Leifsonia xyli]AAT88353.1 xylulose kinase [Leifsonia xyli subsp. xyli str. CTCB07]ODA89788.1 xylulose kinase [Leifsonia xyli subsp. xyli]
MTLVAGVDSSTQSCKVVVRDLGSGTLVRSGRAAHPGGSEVNPAAWRCALTKAVSAAGGLDDVAAISIAGQQHGMVVLDADGRVIRDALLWNDTRSAAAARDLIAEVGAGAYAARAGVVPVASFTATKLRWLRDAEPENAGRVAAVALPHDWLTWRLQGYGPADESPLGPDLEALTTDRSDASGTAYWSSARGTYDLDLFERSLGRAGREAGYPGDGVVLPRVLGPAESADCTPAGAHVGPGAGDNAGAALGLSAADGDVVVSIRTSGTVFAVTGTPVSDASGTVAGFADASGRWLPLVATLNAARVLDAIAGVLGVDHAGLSALALRAEPGSGGAVLVPYFEGERTPNLPDATASVHGLTLASTRRENLARAAIEGMLCGLADGIDALRASGVRERHVLLIGGAAQSPAVATIAAQVFDAVVVVPSPGDYVADGAAVQAAWSLTGQRPRWAVAMSRTLCVDTRTVIREQYAAARTTG